MRFFYRKVIIFLFCLLNLAPKTLALSLNEYSYPEKDLNLPVINECVFENDDVKIEKFQLKLKYASRFGNGFMYEITNKTDDIILLEGIVSKDYFNKDMNGDRISPIKYIILGNFSTGKSYIPYYGIYYRIKVKLEERMFLKNFPKKVIIDSEDSLKMLISNPRNNQSPKAIFLLNIKDIDYEFSL